MRTYLAKRHEQLPDGSVKLVGYWLPFPAVTGSLTLWSPPTADKYLRVLAGAAIVWRLLELVFAGQLVAAGCLAVLVALVAMPPRRVILFDRRACTVRVRHTGLLAERSTRDIRFDEIGELRLDVVRSVAGHDVSALTLVLASGERAALVEIFCGYDNLELPNRLESVRSDAG